ncbi:MAG TPA: alpha/beta hydrolase-fold protein [Luteolibacter sp.]
MTFRNLLSITGLLLTLQVSAHAITIAGKVFEGIIAADGFASGGTAGNTVRTTAPGTFFSQSGSTNTDHLYNHHSGRLDGFVGAGYAASIGLHAGDVLESNSGSEYAPALTTTITGVPAGEYDVYVVYVTQVGKTTGQVNAAFNGGAFKVYDGTQGNTLQGTSGSNTGWQMSFSKVGTTAPGATGWNLQVKTTGYRTLYVGIAYAAVASTPSTWVQDQIFTSSTNPSQSLRYAFLSPPDIQLNVTYPLVVFLHGAGNRGADSTPASQRAAVQAFITPANQIAHPSFVIAPVVPTGKLWADNTTTPGVDNFTNSPYTMKTDPTPELRMMAELVESLKESLPIDDKRVYLVGESMGGYGTWEAAVRYTAKWAAIVPIMGGTDPSKAAELKNLPIWTFHAANDTAVPPAGTRKMVAAIQLAGGHPKYTEYATGGHGISGQAVNTPAQGGVPSLIEWVYAQRGGFIAWLQGKEGNGTPGKEDGPKVDPDSAGTTISTNMPSTVISARHQRREVFPLP